MESIPDTTITVDFKGSVLPNYQIMQSIEYHWLTGRVTRIIFRKADEVIELMDDAEARSGEQ